MHYLVKSDAFVMLQKIVFIIQINDINLNLIFLKIILKKCWKLKIKDWSNRAENSALHLRNTFHFITY